MSLFALFPYGPFDGEAFDRSPYLAYLLNLFHIHAPHDITDTGDGYNKLLEFKIVQGLTDRGARRADLFGDLCLDETVFGGYRALSGSLRGYDDRLSAV